MRQGSHTFSAFSTSSISLRCGAGLFAAEAAAAAAACEGLELGLHQQPELIAAATQVVPACLALAWLVLNLRACTQTLQIKGGGGLLGVLAVAYYTPSILELQLVGCNRVSVCVSMIAAVVGLYYPTSTNLMHIVINFSVYS